MGREIYDIINDMAEVLNASHMQKLQEVLVKRLSENTVSDYLQTTNIVKDTIPDEKIEILRDNCNNLRDRAMIDFLLSTGIHDVRGTSALRGPERSGDSRLNRYRKFWDMSK